MRFNMTTNNNNNDGHEFHPLAEIFPMMDALEFSSLVSSMEQNGYNQSFPILLFEGKILDGRNRYKASAEAKVEPCYSVFEGNYEDAEVYNMDANLHRRHFNKAQKAMMAAKAIQASRDADGKNLSVSKAHLIYGVSDRYVKKALNILNEDTEIAEHLLNGTMHLKEAEYRIMQIQEARTPHEYNSMSQSSDYDNTDTTREATPSSMIIEEFASSPEETAQRVVDIQNQYREVIKKLRECEEKSKLHET